MTSTDRPQSLVARTANAVAPFVGLAAHMGRGVRRLATDAAAGSKRSFPRRVGDLDAETLSKIMGKTVTSVKLLDGSAGTSSRSRLALTGVGVPESVFVKMSAETAAIRMLGELANLGEKEARFYSDLAPQLSFVPKTYGSAFDSLTGRFAIILEDMPQDSVEFFDTTRPLDKDKANSLVETLAHVHGTFWNCLPAAAGGKAPLGWLTQTSDERSLPISRPLMRLSAKRLAEKTDIPVENGRFVIENYPAAVRLIDAGPQTVLHGDSHPGNVYFRDGKAGLLDWQVVKRGHPTRDLVYSLVTGMTTEDRRANQHELLDVYRAALAANGGPELDRDELWDRYRQAAVQPFLAALTTAGLGGMQSEEIALEGLRRAVDAFEDLDTVAILQKSM
jgi:aminoglycoside phosphotransferase (APT) family kinase protein